MSTSSPGVVSRTPPRASRLHAPARLRRLVRLLDDAVRIPGTPLRVGLDALLGLVPGAGDLVGGVLSAAVVVVAARLGAPPSLLTRMVFNVGLDALLGAVPLLGDLFDMGWKANRRNLDLLERHLSSPEATARGSRRALAWAVVSLAAALSLVAVATVWVLVRLYAALT